MAKPMPVKPMAQKPMAPKPMMPNQTPPKPSMPRPSEPPKDWSCCSGGLSGEKLQWILLIGGFVALLIIVMFQQQTIDSLTARVNKSIEGNDYAIAAIEKRVIENVLKTEGVDTAAPTAEAGAPKNVGVPGTNMTLSLPGDWAVETHVPGDKTGAPLVASQGEYPNLIATTATIATEDFQAWYKDYLVKENAGAEIKLPKPQVGPNQVLVGNRLAMDATYGVTTDLGGGDPIILRRVFVRDGGTVIILNMHAVPGEAAVFDGILGSVTFAK